MAVLLAVTCCVADSAVPLQAQAHRARCRQPCLQEGCMLLLRVQLSLGVQLRSPMVTAPASAGGEAGACSVQQQANTIQGACGNHTTLFSSKDCAAGDDMIGECTMHRQQQGVVDMHAVQPPQPLQRLAGSAAAAHLCVLCYVN
jgi:hypothetical protein